jgi:dinuclear metal center YbgI/SA1388 family protein
VASTSTLTDVVAALDARYPPELAADWDSVGLVCGDPAAPVRTVLFAVDPVMAVVDEAIRIGADLIVTHHPLFLHGVHSVSPLTHGGLVVHTLISQDIGLFAAHTNADSARQGVSDALAEALGVTSTRPLIPDTADPGLGIGRVGQLDPPVSLQDFAALVARSLPAVSQGIRVSGDPAGVVRTVAICGGAGDSYLAEAAAVADAYVTSDLRHHRALDHRLGGGCALIDVAHWAGEWPWLHVAAAQLAADLAASGTTVEVHVSAIPTDPWTAHLGSTP